MRKHQFEYDINYGKDLIQAAKRLDLHIHPFNIGNEYMWLEFESLDDKQKIEQEAWGVRHDRWVNGR